MPSIKKSPVDWLPLMTIESATTFALCHGDTGNIANGVSHAQHVLILDLILRHDSDGLRYIPQKRIGPGCRDGFRNGVVAPLACGYHNWRKYRHAFGGAVAPGGGEKRLLHRITIRLRCCFKPGSGQKLIQCGLNGKMSLQPLGRHSFYLSSIKRNLDTRLLRELIQRIIQRIGKNIESLHSYGCRKVGFGENIDWQRQERIPRQSRLPWKTATAWIGQPRRRRQGLQTRRKERKSVSGTTFAKRRKQL